MERSDQELQQAVEAALRQNTQVDPNELKVSVRHATVHLKGTVDSAMEKRAARRTAEEQPGVKSVVDDVTVKNFVKRPDDELVEEVRHGLARDSYVEGDIEVYASSGEVRLDGHVPTYHARKAAEHVAWWTPGVINVENLLLVDEEDFVDVSPLEVTNSG